MITGQVLRKERRDAEVTVSELARRMGITRQSVHRIEGRDNLDPSRVAQYRAALRVTESKG